MAKRVQGLEELLVQELQDLLDAEKQLVKALPKMSKSAAGEELENAFREHLDVTKRQVERLGRIFETMDMRAKSRPCKGMQGIVEEGQEIVEEEMNEELLDAAMVAAGRKVEHYEIASYESARMLAQQAGLTEASGLLRETLQEEIQMDRQLAQISKRVLRDASRRASEEAAASREQAGRGKRRTARAAAHPLVAHDRIRQWAEERGAHPACVRGTGGRGDTGMIRLDFPGYAGEESLEQISWDDWFQKFDENNLALMVQDITAGGERSNFNKIVSRETVENRPRTRTAH